jgi:K+ transporter
MLPDVAAMTCYAISPADAFPAFRARPSSSQTRPSKRIGSFNAMTTSYFLGRETLIPTERPGMALWREKLFASMMRNSSSAAQYFSLPTNQIIELGAQIEM